MSIDDKNESRFFPRMVDIGANKDFSTTEIRYLLVTNIASILGAIYNTIWMLIAIYLTDSPIIYGSNALLGLMFLITLIFNKKGWRVLASIWLTSCIVYISAFISLFVGIFFRRSFHLFLNNYPTLHDIPSKGKEISPCF